ncbi:MAG: hypothetical protein CM15mP74_26420 [Halieaceae bacterium]|nr:MAG: hypothetical protein CM15mP74_26420 [Halieaceae bacterium]
MSRLAMVSSSCSVANPDRATLAGTPGGGFHYLWSDAEEDWLDTKTGARFGRFLVEELLTHTGLRLEWGSGEDTFD